MRRQRPSVVRPWWLRAATAVTVLGLAASSCGGSDEGKPAATTRNTRFPPPPSVDNETLSEGKGACGLLTRAEVEAAVGGTAESGTGVKTETNESCRWSLRSGANQFVAVITSVPGRGAFEGARSRLSGVEQQGGLGDQAFAAGDSVYALKGNRLIIVEVVSSQPAPTRKQAAIKLAQLAVPRG